MLADQPTLPGLTPRGRPRLGISKGERARRNQAKRRRTGANKSLTVEVNGTLLANFKAHASGRLTMRKAVEEAMRSWIAATPFGISKHEDHEGR